VDEKITIGRVVELLKKSGQLKGNFCILMFISFKSAIQNYKCAKHKNAAPFLRFASRLVDVCDTYEAEAGGRCVTTAS
jgi:hypothetical protein